mmetsp:Transcript_21090/g.45975  ORF Transcript_21090/g.45975 Transcript_21090/m.45975 type:complete len:252 (+) Transcript_21090:108-863(+)
MTSFGNTPGMHLQDLILDTKKTASKEEKAEALKLLRVVVKNLSDPTKSQDAKYRQLRLSNPKVQSKLLPCPSAVEYMKAIGFTEVQDEDDGSKYLRIAMDKEVNVNHMQASLVELTNAIAMVDPDAAAARSGPPSRKSSFGADSVGGEEKKSPEGIIIRRSDSAMSAASAGTGSASTAGRMSEKQRARQLMEKKRQKEAEEAKEARKKTANLIKQDKYVRENDENWTSKQSAACVKEGSAINTFRDKFGEG